jgi:hypothetical protein
LATLKFVDGDSKLPGDRSKDLFRANPHAFIRRNGGCWFFVKLPGHGHLLRIYQRDAVELHGLVELMWPSQKPSDRKTVLDVKPWRRSSPSDVRTMT